MSKASGSARALRQPGDENARGGMIDMGVPVTTKKLPAFAAPDARRSRNMAAIKSKNSGPEMEVRGRLHGAGFRYRLHDRKLPGRPDLVLARYRTVVFVHGCFWHSHGCKMSHVPRTNSAYWSAKLARNRERDEMNSRQLVENGWHVEVVWECNLEACIDEVLQRLEDRRTNVRIMQGGDRR